MMKILFRFKALCGILLLLILSFVPFLFTIRPILPYSWQMVKSEYRQWFKALSVTFLAFLKGKPI